jgi:hypothetical protein
MWRRHKPCMASIRHHWATDDDDDTICILWSRNFLTVSRRPKKSLICVVCDENRQNTDPVLQKNQTEQWPCITTKPDRTLTLYYNKTRQNSDPVLQQNQTEHWPCITTKPDRTMTLCYNNRDAISSSLDSCAGDSEFRFRSSWLTSLVVSLYLYQGRENRTILVTRKPFH